MKHECVLCLSPCEQRDYCFGCNEYVCPSCSQNPRVAFLTHDPEDHRAPMLLRRR